MKYLVLIAFSVGAFVSIRIQTNNIAKALYTEGCLDVALKVRDSGQVSTYLIAERFCLARQKSLEEFMGPFD